MPADKSMKSIGQEWAFFEKLLKARGCTPAQLTDARNAYYAGAEAVLRILWSVSGKDTSEHTAMSVLDGLHEECRLFAREYGLTRGLPRPIIDAVAGAFKRGPLSS